MKNAMLAGGSSYASKWSSQSPLYLVDENVLIGMISAHMLRVMLSPTMAMLLPRK